MRIVVNTPTGQVGRAVAERLLETDHQIVLTVRDPQKVRSFQERGAEIKQGSLEDEEFVIQATKDADVLFWVTPPNLQTDDMKAFQQRMGEIAALAVRANGIGRIVNLSSVGAQHGDGAGPISGLHTVENILNQTDAHLTHLRPTFFMENYFLFLPTVASEGKIYAALSPETSFPMIATRDIAEFAAARLVDPDWTGRSVIELIGPAELTCADAARQLGQVLGKEITHVFVSDEQAKTAMTGMGMSAGVADLMLEMYGAMRRKKIVPVGEPRVAGTTFARFAEEVYRPALARAARGTA